MTGNPPLIDDSDVFVLCCVYPPTCLTVTVQLTHKWYHLHLVAPHGGVRTIEFPEDPDCIPKGEVPFVDHVPNPRVVYNWAHKRGMDIDPLAWELMIGRWEDDQTKRYPYIEAIHEKADEDTDTYHRACQAIHEKRAADLTLGEVEAVLHRLGAKLIFSSDACVKGLTAEGIAELLRDRLKAD